MKKEKAKERKKKRGKKNMAKERKKEREKSKWPRKVKRKGKKRKHTGKINKKGVQRQNSLLPKSYKQKKIKILERQNSGPKSHIKIIN